MVKRSLKLYIFIMFAINALFSQFVTDMNIDLSSNITGFKNIDTKKISNIVLQPDDEDQEISIFVQFYGEPHVVKVSTGLRKHSYALVAEYQQGFSRFEMDLNDITATLSKRSLNKKSSFSARIEHNFYKAIYGSSIVTSKKMIPYIAALSYVKEIYINKECHPCLDDVVPIVKADKVWNHSIPNLKTKGKGAVIGILDSAFDLEHPDLKTNIYLTRQKKTVKQVLMMTIMDI